MTKELPNRFKTWIKEHTDPVSVNNSRKIVTGKLTKLYNKFQDGHNAKYADLIERYTNHVGNGDMIICDVSNLDPVG